MFVCVCVCFRCVVLFQDPLIAHIHTRGLAGHFEESKQRIFHQLCELAIFGPAVTALQSICLRQRGCVCVYQHCQSLWCCGIQPHLSCIFLWNNKPACKISDAEKVYVAKIDIVGTSAVHSFPINSVDSFAIMEHAFQKVWCRWSGGDEWRHLSFEVINCSSKGWAITVPRLVLTGYSLSC